MVVLTIQGVSQVSVPWSLHRKQVDKEPALASLIQFSPA